jgi:hypothetical protein
MDTFDYSTLTSVDIDQLRHAAARARCLLAAVTPAAIEIGNSIVEARETIPHGQFGRWCEAALGIEPRRAQIFMNLAKLATTHGRERVEKLSLTAAHHIAARSTPAGVVNDVLNRVAAGDIPTAAVVKALIRETRKVATPPSADPGSEEEIGILSGFLIDALDAPSLGRLRAFLSGASPQAIRELNRRLERPTPIELLRQNGVQSAWGSPDAMVEGRPTEGM